MVLVCALTFALAAQLRRKKTSKFDLPVKATKRRKELLTQIVPTHCVANFHSSLKKDISYVDLLTHLGSNLAIPWCKSEKIVDQEINDFFLLHFHFVPNIL